jgi:phosphoserine aminotransferase
MFIKPITEKLPDLTKVDFNNDIVFTWNGTSSGVLSRCQLDKRRSKRPYNMRCYFISFCNANGLEKIRCYYVVLAESFGRKKAAHGMIALSPRALERLKTYQPSWPIPKIFRLAEDKKVIRRYF